MVSRDKHELVVNKIIELVENGTFRPNEKIYSENKLSMLLGTNRAAIRDVYTALEILGIMKSRQGEGTYLASSSFDNSSKVLLLMMMIAQGNIDEIMQLRKIIEVGAVELSAINRTPKDITVLKSCLRKMESSYDPSVLSKEDTKFHVAIAQSTGNILIEKLLQIFSGYINMVAADHWKMIVSEKDKKVYKTINEQHKQLVNSIVDGKPATACTLMENHLYFINERMKIQKAI